MAVVEGYNYLTSTGVQDASQSVVIDTVTSDMSRRVDIVDYRLGTEGATLGSAAVNSGANADVRVNLRQAIQGDVKAMHYDDTGSSVAGPLTHIDVLGDPPGHSPAATPPSSGVAVLRRMRQDRGGAQPE